LTAPEWKIPYQALCLLTIKPKGKMEAFNKFRVFVIAAVCLFSGSSYVASAKVKYQLESKTGLAGISLGKLRIRVNEAGINGITVDGHEVIGNIFPAIYGPNYKKLGDNSKSSDLILKEPLRLITKSDRKYILIRNVFGFPKSGSAISERELSLSPQGILTVKCCIDPKNIKGKIVQQRLITVMGRAYTDALITVIERNGQTKRLKSFKGSFKNPNKIIMPFGDGKWSFKAKNKIGGKKLTVQLYKSYRRVINASVFSGKKFNVVLQFDFSQLLKNKLKVVKTHAVAKVAKTLAITGVDLLKLPVSRINLIQNPSFESGLYAWRPVISTADNTWMLNRDNNLHGAVSLKYTGTGTRYEAIYSSLCPKRGDYYTVTAWLKGVGNNQNVNFGIGGAPAPPRVRMNYQVMKKIKLGSSWKKYSVTYKIPSSWRGINSVYAILLPEAKTDIVYMDNVGLFAGVPKSGLKTTATYGIIAETNRTGNVFELNKPAGIKYEIIKPVKKHEKLVINYECIDFWGNKIASGNKAVPANGKGTIKVSARNTGAFQVVLKLKDSAQKGLARNTLRYCVMSDQSKSDRSMFGMNFHMERPNAQQLDKTLKLLSFVGVGWVRAWWDWGIAEPRKGQFRWNSFDAQVRLASKHNIDLLCMIGRVYGPKWTGSKIAFAPPDNLADWDNYVRRVVSRYKDRVKYWEIWNEPDIAFKIKQNPALYVELLKRAYKIIKETDSKAEVVGVCGSFFEFIEPVIRSGALDYMDIFSYHCYSLKYNPADSLPGWTGRLNKLIKKYGKDRNIPLWNTEVGVGDDRNGFVTSEEDRRRICGILARNYLAAMSTGTKKLFWFSVDFHSTYTHSLLDYRLLPAPAMVTYNTMVRLFAGSKFLGKISCPEKENFHAMKFKTKAGRFLAAVWYSGFPPERTLNISGSTDVKIYDIVGAPIIIRNKRLQLKTSFPVFLTGNSLVELEKMIKNSRFSKVKAVSENIKSGKSYPVKPVSGPFNITNRGFVIDWRLFGPFSDPGGRGYATGIDQDFLLPFGGEKNAGISSKMRQKYHFAKMTGEKLKLHLKPIEYHGAAAADYYRSKTLINLKTSFKPNKYAAAYAFCYLQAPAEIAAQLRIGSDDGCKVWLNNAMVWRKKTWRATIEDNDIVNVKLKKGINVLLVKIIQDVGGWSFSLRITDRKGSPLKNIKIWL
jgi:Carbohydrate binding domain/Glycosyl hydrolase family 10